MSIHFVTNERIAETSSKGNQEKWVEGNRWYKLDQFGYEALAETLISQLLERSNCEQDYPFRFTRYQMERITAHGVERTGCSSENFLLPGQSIITLSHLYKRESEVSLRALLSRQSSDKKRIAYLADATAELTGLELFPQYLTLLFEVDALFLNDDRHLNNIAVLECDGKYDYCPIFDNGAGLLSNTRTAPMDIEPKALIAAQRARPFGTTFNRQAGAVRALYGKQMYLLKLSREDKPAPFFSRFPTLVNLGHELCRGLGSHIFRVFRRQQKRKAVAIQRLLKKYIKSLRQAQAVVGKNILRLLLDFRIDAHLKRRCFRCGSHIDI